MEDRGSRGERRNTRYNLWRNNLLFTGQELQVALLSTLLFALAIVSLLSTLYLFREYELPITIREKRKNWKSRIYRVSFVPSTQYRLRRLTMVPGGREADRVESRNQKPPPLGITYVYES